MRIPDRLYGGLVFGKIRGHIEVARSSRNFAYGGIRSENRASTGVLGPSSFGNPNGCSPRPRFAKKYLKSLDKSKFGPGTAIIGPRKNPLISRGFRLSLHSGRGLLHSSIPALDYLPAVTVPRRFDIVLQWGIFRSWWSIRPPSAKLRKIAGIVLSS